MGKFFVPSKGAISWKEHLADPEKQWKVGYSAYELANSWDGTDGLPENIRKVFDQSGMDLFKEVTLLYGFPEYKVSLPGGSASSQNDLYVLAKAGSELLPIMVEGKVSEPFGETVTSWLGGNPSMGKRERLKHLLTTLDLREEEVLNIRYQLIHRAASALIEAEKVNAKNALFLVHSFSQQSKWFEDYSNFVKLFGLLAKRNNVVGPADVYGINLYFCWVTEVLVKSKEYFFSLFPTERAKDLAREVDEYLYKKSPYFREVEDSHDRFNNGIRTDCIGYVSKKGNYKFATLTSARKVVFVLHLGKRLHSETAKNMQKEIDELLGRNYEDFDRSKLTDGEVYIRLEWVDKLEQIIPFIDKAYEMRLQR
ncbi:DUF6946 family protein [Sutcliffiella horikoshii]|uniref:DUF6946 family protein n=1 Tax=Sutcliffiella horikoshii TaxID=79883 RepID=UPI001CFE64B1|nr:hypothetical protein [Sutcliffiella horikoshii]